MIIARRTPVTVIHVISGLGHGGAERMLLRLVSGRKSAELRHEVVSLTSGGALRQRFEELGVPVRDFGLRRPPSPFGLARLVRHFRRREPDVVQGWLYDGNVAAALARLPWTGDARLAWNVRHSLRDLSRERLAIRVSVRAGSLLSRLPAVIVYNARRSAEQHETLGFPRDRRKIVPNGFDTDRFRPRPEARASLLRELGLAGRAEGGGPPTLVGTVGRDHPMKDHEGLLEAAARLPDHLASGGRVHLVLAGPGLDPEHGRLNRAARRLGLEGRVHLLGPRDDVPTILAGLDVFALPSAYGESFPNVLGEAMATGLPCVATDVGDSSLLLGDHGEVVPPEDPGALARALARLLSLQPERRRELGAAARGRVRTRFSLARVVQTYEKLWADLAAGDVQCAA